MLLWPCLAACLRRREGGATSLYVGEGRGYYADVVRVLLHYTSKNLPPPRLLFLRLFYAKPPSTPADKTMAGCRAHTELEAEKLTCEIVELENSVVHLVRFVVLAQQGVLWERRGMREGGYGTGTPSPFSYAIGFTWHSVQDVGALLFERGCV